MITCAYCKKYVSPRLCIYTMVDGALQYFCNQSCITHYKEEYEA